MTTALDIITLALKDCGAFSTGQSPNPEDTNDALTTMNMMVNQWARKRWLAWCTQTTGFTSDGRVATPYTVGPGGNYNLSPRPEKIEAAFLRQLTQAAPNQPDFPLEVLQSREDYNNVALKQLQSFPWFCFYDPTLTTAGLYLYPWPQASIYAVYITTKVILPTFGTLTTTFDTGFPPEYQAALHYNLVLRLGLRYPITRDFTMLDQWQTIKGLAREALNVIRGGNTAISRLGMPPGLNRPGIYNIFSDQIR